MSTTRICDKCEKVLVCNPSAKIDVDFGYYGTEHFELCEDCKKILVRWLTERKRVTRAPICANTCISCGESIPEGRQVCPKCESK